MKSERGVVLPIVTLWVSLLLVMAALALDLSSAFLAQHQLQVAADSAALGGAQLLPLGDGLAHREAVWLFTANLEAPGVPWQQWDVTETDQRTNTDYVVQTSARVPSHFGVLMGVRLITVRATAAARPEQHGGHPGSRLVTAP